MREIQSDSNVYVANVLSQAPAEEEGESVAISDESS